MSFVLADRTVPSPSSNAGSLDLDDDEPADPGSQAWLDYCAQAIIAAHADGGRVLVLPTSFATIAALVERTEKVLGSHLLDHRSEEHTSELQSLMRISYAVFCLQKKTTLIPSSALKQTHKLPVHNK